MIKVALFEPEIPQNTGNIARLCAGTGTELILVEPLGFSISEKQVRRAGLDYWDSVNLTTVPSITDFFKTYSQPDTYFAFLSKFSSIPYTEIQSRAETENMIIIFGKETSGLPEEIHTNYEHQLYQIPMTDAVRSLNLSNSVAIVLYDLLRQRQFCF